MKATALVVGGIVAVTAGIVFSNRHSKKTNHGYERRLANRKFVEMQNDTTAAQPFSSH
eukprot:CAMPEP_0173380882 /NCGR_PEP_ID=MMETSP1356-20130122/3455_1 /TAXON_ID=77927 ORGANISM="Hemiselmis virescens, Strain PCC157" /NCGR_SAMPLE_ID=MMETSP1356 /ASSEMBLY_ACC=CAM_ASM_000847 /LENGTH=57 /DNA_ID=CAMNT_0014334597 /DNA_START=39 /DNA_END=212 /DNA_ORIENTATION=-